MTSKLRNSKPPMHVGIAGISKLLSVSEDSLRFLLANIDKQYCTQQVVTKSGRQRKFYIPYSHLRDLQVRVNGWLKTFPLSKACHGWRTGRSAKSNAAEHINKNVVSKIDIKDFFLSIHFQQVNNLFQKLGCDSEAASVLTRLTTADHHLPQGFITSPSIANLVLRRFDQTIRNSSIRSGVSFTRYGDDIAFSANTPLDSIRNEIRRQIVRNGFKINENKCVIFGERGDGEEKVICGIVVSDRLAIPSDKFEEYKDFIISCGNQVAIEEGSEKEDYASIKMRCRGILAYVTSVNKEQAQVLRNLFDSIIW